MKKSLALVSILTLILQSCFVSNTTKLKSHKPIFGKVKTHENEIENSGQVSQEQIIRSEVKAEILSQISYENSEITDLATTENEIIDIPKQKNNVFDGGCDKITFLNGNEEEVKLMEIGDDFVKYKKCNNLEGPIYSTSKEKLFMITFSNGSKEVINHEESKVKSNYQEQNNSSVSNRNNFNSEPLTNGLAITSFVFGVLGFIPLLGIILGIIANNQITKNPEKYKGKGFATAGILLSFLWLVLLFLLILV